MSAAHTAGPWAWTHISFGSSFMEEDAEGLIIYPESAGSGFAALMGEQIIAAPHVHHWTDDDGNEVDDRAEAEANSRLMAAAPCLLSALEALLSHDEQDAGCVPTDAHLDAQNDARAAIAKATTAIEPNSVGTERSEVNQ